MVSLDATSCMRASPDLPNTRATMHHAAIQIPKHDRFYADRRSSADVERRESRPSYVGVDVQSAAQALLCLRQWFALERRQSLLWAVASLQAHRGSSACHPLVSLPWSNRSRSTSINALVGTCKTVIYTDPVANPVNQLESFKLSARGHERWQSPIADSPRCLDVLLF